MRDVEFIAGVIGPRNVYQAAKLEQAARYIDESFGCSGYAVYSQYFDSEGQRVRNIQAEIRGANTPDEVVVIGAHYDTVEDSPGADDNASGVAAVLEIARMFNRTTPGRTIRLVAFANEEPPFFRTSEMGSWVYARAARAAGENIVAMLSLESIGYFSSEPGSQRLPFPVPIYSRTADFIGFVSNLRSARLLRRIVGTFRSHSAVPAESLAAPPLIPEIGFSDNWSFWKEGYRAVMVTGTAMFRNEHYHEPTDLPNTLDYDRLTDVVVGLFHVAADLVQVR